MLAEWRDFPQPWRRPPFDRTREMGRLIASLHRLADLTVAPSSTRDNLFCTDGVRRLSRQIRLEESFGPPSRRGRFDEATPPGHGSPDAEASEGRRDLDGWEARLVDLIRERGLSRTRKGSGYKFGQDVTRAEVLAARDALFAELQQFRQDADADLAACLQQELAGATARYQVLKAAAGALDFGDLLAKAA